MRTKSNINDKKWNYKYTLAKAYYEHYGNLEIPQYFKTKNGYEYDEEGLALGKWINNQRQAYKEKGTYKITSHQVELLKKIGMRFENIDRNEEWNKKYNLAKAYYEHYGNLEIPRYFKTKNGYDYNEDGIALGKWIQTQRDAYKGQGACKITSHQVELLRKTGMRFENIDRNEEWNKKYNLAKAYYEYYGNLKIPQYFKTKNGYEYDEKGILLGIWIQTQRDAYKGKRKITSHQVELLKKIGMRFENIDRNEEWNKKYNLAKAYYEYYGNLKIPQYFKTKNGYEYDEKGIALGQWLTHQKKAYKGKGTVEVNYERIKLLEKIEINWFKETTDYKLQNEKITSKNLKRKRQELISRAISVVNNFDENTLPDQEELNKKFIKILSHKK